MRAARRVFLCAGIGLFMAASSIGLPTAGADQPRDRWVGTWSTSPMPPVATFAPPIFAFENQTLRQIVHVSLGGQQVRVRLSNLFGSAPLKIGAARLALQASAESIVPCSDRQLTFSGRASVTIPVGQDVLTDPVQLEFPSAADLAISIYLPESTGPVTWHETAQQTTYISSTGNFAGVTKLPTAATSTSYYLISDVEVRRNAYAVVAFGDSITDGFQSTTDANHRWPDFLSQRLNPSPGPHHGRIGVLNQGISGNRVLHDFVGPSGLGRFDRDVLAQPGARHVIVALGINDIGLANAFGLETVSAPEIIAGLDQLIARAHANHLRIYGGTLTPFEGTIYPGYFTAEGEAKRQAVNQWLRTSGAFDAVIDFDAALQDPAQPTRLLPAYDSGDHLHPNDAGYQAMANAVDLGLILR